MAQLNGSSTPAPIQTPTPTPTPAAAEAAAAAAAAEESQRLARVRSRSYRKETQATLRMLMIILIFVITWMPFMFMYILSSFNSSLVINEHVQKTVIWLGYTSSAINPIIIFTYSQDFRLALRSIVCQRNKRSSVSLRSSVSSRFKSSRSFS